VERAAAVLPWIEGRRAAGDRVLAVNLHPALFAVDQRVEVDALIDSVAGVLARLSAARPVSWLLLPHDFRGERGDNACLGPLAQRLSARLGPRLLHAAGPWSAAELKAIAGATDAVFTGRMHLAIAALGQGVPVAALTYQGKFHGLWRHFDLPTDLLLAPADALDPMRLEAVLSQLLDDIETLGRQVRSHLPQVRAAAAANLAPLTGDSA
jgi:polysaccharide pyruvyl transferase WcaK-like protein